MESLLDMRSYFEERMAKFEADLHKKPSSSHPSIAEDFAAFKTFVLQSLKSFSEQLEVVGREVDKIETRNRRKMLLLHGVEESKDEETAQVISNIVKQHLNISSFSSVDVERCHRLGRQSSNGKSRPILMKLHNVAVRDSLWLSKTKLKGTGITLSEFLTRSRHNTFMAARDRFGVHKCWTKEGNIYVLGPDGSRHRIASLSDLGKIKGTVTESSSAGVVSARPKRAAAVKK